MSKTINGGEISLFIEFCAGTDIKDAISDAWLLSLQKDSWVRFDFNECKMKIHSNLNKSDYVAIYESKLKK